MSSTRMNTPVLQVPREITIPPPGLCYGSKCCFSWWNRRRRNLLQVFRSAPRSTLGGRHE